MLDLIFLILFVIIFLRSLNGYYNENLCNAALVIGIIAALVGAVASLMTGDYNMSLLNVFVFLIAIAQRYAARYLAKLHNEKVAQSQKELEDYIELHSRKRHTEYNMSDDDFDREDLRFGKGGFTQYNEGLDYDPSDENADVSEKTTLGDKK